MNQAFSLLVTPSDCWGFWFAVYKNTLMIPLIAWAAFWTLPRVSIKLRAGEFLWTIAYPVILSKGTSAGMFTNHRSVLSLGPGIHRPSTANLCCDVTYKILPSLSVSITSTTPTKPFVFLVVRVLVTPSMRRVLDIVMSVCMYCWRPTVSSGADPVRGKDGPACAMVILCGTDSCSRDAG